MWRVGAGDEREATVYYPVFLNVAGRHCLVVGGGKVASRKVEALLRHGAAVRVVSPRVAPELARMAAAGRVELHRREYRPGDAAGAFLVFAATGDAEVNRRIREEAVRCGALVNAVDDPEHSDFVLPAVVERGDLTIAVATAGKSPALARRLRERLEREFGDEYALWLDILAEARRLARERLPDPDARAEFLFSLVDDPAYLELLRAGRAAEARQRMTAALTAAVLGKEAE